MIKPVGNKIVLFMIEEEYVQGTIIIPDVAKEKTIKGKVIAVGPGAMNLLNNIVPLTVKVGDEVIISKYAGQPLEIDKVKYIVIKEDDIIGVL